MKQLFFFSAPWCEHCKHLEPAIDQIQKQIPVEKINIEYEEERTRDAKVNSIPTVVLAQNGQEIKRFTGTKSYEQLLAWLNG